MNGFKAKNNFSEGVEKCIARGIRCFAAMPKKSLFLCYLYKFSNNSKLVLLYLNCSAGRELKLCSLVY
jgi:hypothetical protein